MKRIVLGFAALVACVGFAVAGGAFYGYPVAGGASYCSSTTNGVCTNTVPSALAYGAYIPGDTWLSASLPQTVYIPGSTMGAGVQNATPLTGASITVTANTGKLMLDLAGTIATLTVTLPPSTSLFDGQTFYLNSDNIVTALTLTAGSGTTLGTTTTALAVNTPIRYTYSAATLVWIKG